MAYRRSSSRRTSYTRSRRRVTRAPVRRRSARPSRARRSASSAGRTIRIVIEQPGAALGRGLALIGQKEAKPKQAKF